MPFLHPLLAWLAPTNPVETALAQQAADASDAMDRLRAVSPETPTPAWLRSYSQAQNLFRKALADLEKLRKTTPVPATPPPSKTLQPSSPTAPRPLPPPPAPPRPSTPALPTSTLAIQATPLVAPRLNRQDRRRLEAYKRSISSPRPGQAGLSPRAADAILSPSTP